MPTPTLALLDWFAGNGRYMSLWHCMGHDTPWVVATVLLDFAVAAGYVLIAYHWWQNEKALQNREARVALGRMRNIFIFCGICGYIFIPVKMIWPAWRLYDIFLVFLVYYTWRYAWNAKDLRVVYRELTRSQDLATELEASRAESYRKSFFLNAISHDLKNPLYALNLQAHVLEEAAEDGDAEATRESTANIRQCIAEAQQVLDQYLELGRADFGADVLRPEELRVEDVVIDVLRPMAPLAERKRLRLVNQVSPQLRVYTDRVCLDRALANIVSNAIRYTDEGTVEVWAEAVGEQVRISVIDTGRGIADADRGRLFEEFFQADNPERDRNKGHGLGLSIAQRMVGRVDGEIEVESVLGAGSTFTIVVPRRFEPLATNGPARDTNAPATEGAA